jgi:hypothetical protein
VLTFPGGTGVSWLSFPGVAGKRRRGDVPHAHLICTQAYVAVSGTGSLQTLTVDGLRESRLRTGTVAWFGPGTIHHTIDGDGALRVMVVTQNGGLPEAGDAVPTFPAEVLDDRKSYDRALALEPAELRDLALRGYDDLADGGVEALHEFYRQAAVLVAGGMAEWEEIWRAGPREVTRRSLEQMDAVRAGDIGHLLDAEVRVERVPEPEDSAAGHLDRAG